MHSGIVFSIPGMLSARLLGLPPAVGAAHRRSRAGRMAAAAPPPGSKPDNGYFSEADPTQGVRTLWGQGPKKDLIKEVRFGKQLGACWGLQAAA